MSVTFGRDPITPIAKLLEPKSRYYGEKGSALKMDTLRRLYTVIVENIRKARSKRSQQMESTPHKFKINDMVLVKDPDSAVFEPRYQPNYRVTAIFGQNRIEVQDEKGHKSVRPSSHVKYVEPSEKIVHLLPSKELLQKYGRSFKVLLAEKDIPDLYFTIDGESKLPEHSQNSLNPAREVMHVTEMNECPRAAGKLCSSSLQNNDNHEQSGNSSGKAMEKRPKRYKAGVALEDSRTETTECGYENQQIKEDRTLKHSLKGSSGAAGIELQIAKRCGESRELSQNSVKVKDGPCLQTHQRSDHNAEGKQGLDRSSKCGEYSPVSCPMTSTEEKDGRTIGRDDSSESSHESSKCVGNDVSVPRVTWFKSVSKLVGLTAAWQPSKLEGYPVGVNTAGSPKANNSSVHTEFNFFL